MAAQFQHGSGSRVIVVRKLVGLSVFLLSPREQVLHALTFTLNTV